MKYSLTDKLPDCYPMTPPDDPPEPDLSDALPCPQCQYPPICQRSNHRSLHGQFEFRLHCDQGHVDGGWSRSFERAIEHWNTECETISGENLKAEGVATVAENNEAWMDGVLDVIRFWASSGMEFTVQNVRAQYNTLEHATTPKSPNAWGAAFSVAAKQGLIVRVGYQPNKIASAHSRIVATWKGKS